MYGTKVFNYRPEYLKNLWLLMHNAGESKEKIKLALQANFFTHRRCSFIAEAASFVENQSLVFNKESY